MEKPKIGIARWLFAAFVGVSCIVVIVIGLSLNTSRLVQQNSEQLVQQGLPALEEISNLESSLSALVNQIYIYYATTERKPFIEAQDTYFVNIQQELKLLRKHTLSEQDMLLLEREFMALQRAIQSFELEMAAPIRDWDLLRTKLAETQMTTDALHHALALQQSKIRNNAREGGQETLNQVNKISVMLAVFSLSITTVSAFVLLALYSRLKDRDELFRLAYEDELTGLPNRQQLEEHLEARIHHQNSGGLLLLRIARYDLLTSTYGYTTGHLLILHASQWLEQTLACLPIEGSLYRYSEDSWMIYCHDKIDKPTLSALAEKLLELAEHPISVEQRPFNMTCTIGISRHPTDGLKVEPLLRNVQAALQDASDNPDGYCFFDAEMTTNREQWLATDAALRDALEQDFFELYYQTKVDATTSQPIGAEALIRWWRDGEMIAPGYFISIAEQSGLIVDIGNWVLKQACRQIRSWLDQELEVLPVAINISAQQFQQPNFPELVASTLADFGVNPSLIELEITEQVAAAHPDQVVATMTRLKGIGVSIALDDFGTGYSSLSYLQRFPIDTLKIDRSFVRFMDSCTDNFAIVDLMLSLARKMGYKVVAEGVETSEQHAALKAKGCDYLQGFLFARPEPASQFTRLLKKRALVVAS